MTVHFRAMPTALVTALRTGSPDAYGLAVERVTSDGGGNPCRHCLSDIPKGAEMLILSHRPFEGLHPYAETGPIFLCGECDRWPDGPALPPVIAHRREMLVKGYDANERIRYGTGQITATADIAAYCATLLNDSETATTHLRSATNNCYICRVDRA